LCGIVGYVSKNKHSLGNHLSAMQHRGPDASGEYYEEKLGLGQVRLSIVDTKAESNQPFCLHNGEFVIVFNGEIYNFKELRTKLSSLGYMFTTSSDTEVLLNTYIEYGTDMFEYLDGMFAFSIFDKKKNQLLSGRDHLGIKPFYYYLDKPSKEFYFASELSTLFEFPIKKIVDENAITEFLFNGWIYEPNTGLKDIYKIQPGEYLKIDLNDFKIEKKLYFDVSDETTVHQPDQSIDNIIKDSVNLQSYNEVKIGNFFSGGIDSTVIASLINKDVKNLTVKYDEDDVESAGIENDAYYADKISKELDLDIDYISIADKMTPLEKIQYVASNTDDLVSDFTFIATEEISKESQNRDYKIMLSGMGADELFCGYPRYKMVYFENIFKPVSLLIRPFYPLIKNNKNIAKKIDRFFSYFSAKSFGIAYSQLLGYFSFVEINNLVKNKKSIVVYESKLESMLKKVKNASKLKQAMYLDIYGFLSHNFMISDKASMLHSIELRVPLTTKDILQKNFFAKDSKLLSFKKTKLQLRKFLYPLIPAEYVDRKKAGFNPPLDQIILDIGEEEILLILEESPISEYLNMQVVNNLINEHFSRTANNTYKVWQLLYLHYWLEHHSR
jgi:asparagine synthase (glutamine-hydrolysing)